MTWRIELEKMIVFCLVFVKFRVRVSVGLKVRVRVGFRVSVGFRLRVRVSSVFNFN